jgi:predicted nicotinamide N-methyase
MHFQYHTHTDAIPLGDLTIHLTRVTNLDALLDALVAKGDDHADVQDERLPYWADLWHAAIALAEYLVDNRVVVPGMTVTEIGCGLGLPGIAAARMGGAVTMTDYLQEALDFLATNWAQNVDTPLRAFPLDWRQPEARFKSQLLLASDVAYESRSFDALTATLADLADPGTRVILTEPNRPIAQDFIRSLVRDTRYQTTVSQRNIDWKGTVRLVNVVDMRRV